MTHGLNTRVTLCTHFVRSAPGMSSRPGRPRPGTARGRNGTDGPNAAAVKCAGALANATK